MIMKQCGAVSVDDVSPYSPLSLFTHMNMHN